MWHRPPCWTARLSGRAASFVIGPMRKRAREAAKPAPSTSEPAQSELLSKRSSVDGAGQGSMVSDPAFRRARARLAAYALHHRHPALAAEAGRKGGEATSERYPLGKRAWGVAMALRRWYRTPFSYFESRALRAGPGGDGGGAPEPGPAMAQKTPIAGRRRRDKLRS